MNPVMASGKGGTGKTTLAVVKGQVLIFNELCHGTGFNAHTRLVSECAGRCYPVRVGTVLTWDL